MDELVDVRNTVNKLQRFRSFMKGSRAKKQASTRYTTWQSTGNKVAHHDGVTCPMQLEQIFDKMFHEKQGFNCKNFGRNDPFGKTIEGVYFLKSEDEN